VETAPRSLTTLLREIAERMKRAAGADIVSLHLFDEEHDRYYAPVIIGVPEKGLAESLEDMGDQLARYRSDAAQGKAPDELNVTHYGSNVWLTITRRTLVAADAQAEVDSSFIRRHQVVSVVGLPLVAGRQMLGLLYLDFQEPSRAPDAEQLAELERQAGEAAESIQGALADAEREALAALGRLAARLARTGSGDVATGVIELVRSAPLEAAALYQVSAAGHLELVTAQGLSGVPAIVEVPAESSRWEAALWPALAPVATGLQPAGFFALASGDQVHGCLLLLSEDPLARHRIAPATGRFLKTSADLLAGALASRRLLEGLADANRVLGALSRMTSAMLQPGSSREEVLKALVQHLTEPEVPEFDFELASVFLLEEADGGLAVRMAAGSEPLEQHRALAPDDVLCFVARRWQPVVVGALGARELLEGYEPGEVRSSQVPAIRPDGTVAATVPICLVTPKGVIAEPPFTLAGDIFEAKGHGELNRIFVPFGMDSTSRATGVLEVSQRQGGDRPLDRTRVEAVRAAAAQIAVAVETARLYEAARRHAEQLQVSADITSAIASSIDLEQTLRLVARNLVRLADVSVCQIALYEEDGSGWYGAAASRQEEEWKHQRAERSDPSFLFEVLDRRAPLLIEDVAASPLVPDAYAARFGVRSLLALPLLADGQAIGAAVLGQTDKARTFSREEVDLAEGVALQAAVAIKNARLHALAEEERHLQKDFVLVGFGQWGQKAYGHLLTLKQFFNFKTHVVQAEVPGARESLATKVEEVLGNGDAFYWDAPSSPALEQLSRELEGSSYVVTYIATPAVTHLATLARYYDLSDVVVIEKPLGDSPEAYREFLDSVSGAVQVVAADHYYFKLEVRLLDLLLTEERTLRAFLESVDEIRIEILEEKPLTGAAADIGIVADMIPHAFAIISLLTPIQAIKLDPMRPLQIGRQEPLQGDRETFARVNATFPYQGRPVRLLIDVGKGIEDQKWIKLTGERPLSGRPSFYKFDFGRGEAVDGTQSNVRAALRRIRQPGVPDNAHLTMLRHVIQKRHPAVGILSIREAIRSNQRILELQAQADELLKRGDWATYTQGSRPAFRA
jgi:GAF domain-containing protein